VRIALITETFLPEVNGVVTTICRLLEHLQRRGHQTVLFAQPSAPSSYAGAEVVRLHGFPLPLYNHVSLVPPQMGFVPRLRRFKPDVIHLAGTCVLGPTGRFAAARLGVPLVATYHTDWPSYAAFYGFGMLRDAVYKYLRWVHNGCTLTFCPSSATLNDLRAHGFRRLRRWGRGVDTVRFTPEKRSEAWRASVGAQPNERLLLYVGRLANEKRIDVLVEAVQQLPNARLVLVGDGPARSGLEKRLAGTPAHFTGYLRGDDLATAFASADLFAFPSDTETFGQVLQEAMASGLPLVAARAGGAIDLVREGQTGFTFTPGDATDMREKLCALIANPALRRTMSDNGRAFAEQRTWSAVGDEMLDYYRRAVHGFRRAERARAAMRSVAV
jgi:glycosyltransferase involved in cell wall biosynthesis